MKLLSLMKIKITEITHICIVGMLVVKISIVISKDYD